MVAALLTTAAVPAAAEPNRIATFPVASNLPAGKDKLSAASAEIITTTDDGMTLIYSDSPLGAIGLVEISDAKAPKAGGALMMDGVPTSVTSAAGKALVALNTSESKAKPSGRLAIVDVATKKIERTCDLGGQPDSIALNKDKTLGAIAIENERDEEVNDGKIPQMPAGDLVVFQVKDGTVDCGSIKHVTLTGLAGIAPDDPEPEFVSFNDQDEIALTLQENNEIVIIDAATAAVKAHFSAGSVDLVGIDTKRDGEGGPRSHVMIYELAEGEMDYPQIVAAEKDGNPVGFAALSGLTAVPEKPGQLFAVSDSVLGMLPTIYTIDATKKPAVITETVTVKRDGQPAQKLDIEGVAVDEKGWFWLASEGNSEKLVPRTLYHVNPKGEIKEEIALPKELAANEIRYGFEGVTIVGSGNDATLWMAVQREWKDDEKGFVKLVSYNPKSKEWGAVRYPLDKSEAGWVGLSEISAHGDSVYIIERDNLVGDAAKLKKLYKVAMSDLKPAKLGGELPVVRKTEAHDFLPELKTATNGYVLDKIEGFAFDASGKAYAVTDNDGVDDSSGECSSRSISSARTEIGFATEQKWPGLRPAIFLRQNYQR